MSIIIHQEKCVGCKQCIQICPGSLIKADASGKAYIRYPKDCWGCASCLKECKTGAIELYLGADMGGMGATMNITRRGSVLCWNITKSSGERETIEINQRESNQY